MTKWARVRGAEASRLRQRKFELIREFGIPEDLLPGSLALTHTKCGKANCHCADGDGHSGWSLTFMVDGKKRVQRIPREWVEEIRPLVEQGRRYKEAVAEVFASNAQLLALWRREARKQRPGKK